MKRLVSVFVLILTLAVTSMTHAQPPLTMALTGVEEGSQGAIAVQKYMDHLTADLGVKIQISCMASKRAINMLKQGKLDGDVARIEKFGSLVPQLIRLAEPISRVNYYAYATDKTINVDQGWESLADQKVAHIKGLKQIEIKLGDHGNRIPVKSARQGLRMVAAGRADVFALTNTVVGPLLNTDEFKGKGIVALQPPLERIAIYIYVQPRHAELAKQLNEKIQASRADGSHEKYLPGQ